MHKYALQLERLRRHYETAVRTYDVIGFWDLSNALRIWADLKSVLHTEVPAFATTLAFKSGAPSRGLTRLAHGHAYVFAFMPGGVTTYASNGSIAASSVEAGRGTLGAWVKKNSDGSIELKNFCFIADAVDDPLSRALMSEQVSRCNFINWLGAEAARVSYRTDDGVLDGATISREQLIRRVANTMDGSHPSSTIGDSEFVNRFDGPVRHLLKSSMGGIHLPYFILLKVAQDLLAIAPRLLEK